MISLPIHIDNGSVINEPWHPSIVYRSSGWNGFPYWMAYSPYPIAEVKPYRDWWECPCVCFSKDGKKWRGITNNPIDELTNEQIEKRAYFSDPHLVLQNDTLYCYYRLTIEYQTWLLSKYSIDGHHWSERHIIADLCTERDIKIWGRYIISPAIVSVTKEVSRCWYVDKAYKDIESDAILHRKVRVATMVCDVALNESEVCVLTGKYINPWHIDVQKIEDYYYMLIYETESQGISLFSSLDGLTFKYLSDVTCPTRNRFDFDCYGIYRACLVRVNNVYRVYYSAHNTMHSSIGVLCSNDLIHFSRKSGDTFLNTIKYNVLCGWKSLKRIVNKYMCII